MRASSHQQRAHRGGVPVMAAVGRRSATSRRGAAGARRRASGTRGEAVAAIDAGVREGSAGREAAGSVAEIQRTRLLGAAVSVFDELGYQGATIAHITRRARVSRRTFYELFGDREECLLAVIDDALRALEGELAGGEPQRPSWCERVRVGLRVVLELCDRDPALARVCVVQSSRAGSAVLARRETILARLVAVVDAGRGESERAQGCSPLTAEGLVGAVLRIVQRRLQERDGGQLVELEGQLMSVLVLPYLGVAAARRELLRAPAVLARGADDGGSGTGWVTGDPLEGLAMRITYRTARVLQGAAQCPGLSNRQLAASAGIGDEGQASRLFVRLQRLGLLANQSAGRLKGVPNAWALTDRGVRVVKAIGAEGVTSRAVRREVCAPRPR